MTNPQAPPDRPARRTWPSRVSGSRARVSANLRRGGARVRRTIPFATGVVAALIAVALYGIAVPGPRPLTQQDVTRGITAALASQTPGPAFSQLVYQKVEPSLVLVETTGTGASASPVPSPSGVTLTSDGSQGSGVIVDATGDILTCLHVVADASSIEVTFADGTKSPATILSTQPDNDIAVLKASQPPSTIKPAVLGNPRSVQVGSEAFVLGSPFGLYASMSSGIVSGLNRSFQLPNGPQLQGLIQIDAAVNPGNSGGPLVNRYGQVVGIVSGLVNPTQQDVFIGIGFAVPITVAGGAAGLPPD